MATIFDWSTIAANNDTADADINWKEGQFPDTVNNSARQMMARIAEWIKDQGVLAAGGTATAISLPTANTSMTVPVGGMTVAFRAAVTNTGATTLALNGGGSKPLRKVFVGDTAARALEAGDIVAQGVYLAHYDANANAGAGAWIMVNPTNYEQMKAVVLTAINNAPEKASVVDADAAVFTDSEDDGKSKRVLGSTIKAWLKAYFDTIYYVRSLVYTKTETDGAISSAVGNKVTGDFVTVVGLDGDNPSSPYVRRKSNNQVVYLQQKLSFTPVQQYKSGTIRIGWNGSRLSAQVDATDFNGNWPIDISGHASSAGNANTVGGWSTTTIQNQINAAGAGKVSSGVNNQEIGAAFTKDGIALIIRGDTSYTAIEFWNKASNRRGHISVTSNGTQYNSSSDYRLKCNVEELDIDDALEVVNKIRPVKYNWRDNPDDAKSTGFIAHELQALFPDAVSGEKDAVDSEGNPVYQGVDHGRVTPILVSAIQALARRVDQLEQVK